MTHISFEKDFSHHPLHYFTLLCMFVFGLWGIFWFDYNPAIQVAIVTSMAVAYVIWGIVHHAMHRDLHVRIVLEYVIMAVLAIVIFSSLILRT